MIEQAITDALIHLLSQLPPEMRSGVLWLGSNYDSVGRPVLTLGFLVILLVEIAIASLVVRAFTRD